MTLADPLPEPLLFKDALDQGLLTDEFLEEFYIAHTLDTASYMTYLEDSFTFLLHIAPSGRRHTMKRKFREHYYNLTGKINPISYVTIPSSLTWQIGKEAAYIHKGFKEFGKDYIEKHFIPLFTPKAIKMLDIAGWIITMKPDKTKKHKVSFDARKRG